MESTLNNYPSSSAQQTSDENSFEINFESINLYFKTFEEIQIKYLRCYIKDCHEIVRFKCKCSAKVIFICEVHLIEHMRKGIPKNNQKKKKTHNPMVLNNEIHDKPRDKVVNYLRHYNSDMKNLKKKMALKVTEFVKKINQDMCLLFKNMDAIISRNNQKIRDLTSMEIKILENMTNKQSNYLKEFTKICDKMEISDECLHIIQAEISD